MSRMGLIASILIGLLVTAAWWFLLVGPQRVREADAADQLEAAESEELVLRTELAQLERIQENELPYRAAIAELQTAIPDRPQTASLIDDLAALAEETGVDWDSGTYGNPALNEDTGLFEIPLGISIQGQFFEVLGYLFGVAELDRIVRIDSVNIAPTQDDNNFTVLNTNITGRAFANGAVLVPVPEEEGPDAPASDPADDEGGESDESGETTTTTAAEADTTTTTAVTDDSSPSGDARIGGWF